MSVAKLMGSKLMTSGAARKNVQMNNSSDGVDDDGYSDDVKRL